MFFLLKYGCEFTEKGLEGHLSNQLAVLSPGEKEVMGRAELYALNTSGLLDK